jgi:hypothetical protein
MVVAAVAGDGIMAVVEVAGTPAGAAASEVNAVTILVPTPAVAKVVAVAEVAAPPAAVAAAAVAIVFTSPLAVAMAVQAEAATVTLRSQHRT